MAIDNITNDDIINSASSTPATPRKGKGKGVTVEAAPVAAATPAFAIVEAPQAVTPVTDTWNLRVTQAAIYMVVKSNGSVSAAVHGVLIDEAGQSVLNAKGQPDFRTVFLYDNMAVTTSGANPSRITNAEGAPIGVADSTGKPITTMLQLAHFGLAVGAVFSATGATNSQVREYNGTSITDVTMRASHIQLIKPMRAAASAVRLAANTSSEDTAKIFAALGVSQDAATAGAPSDFPF